MANCGPASQSWVLELVLERVSWSWMGRGTHWFLRKVAIGSRYKADQKTTMSVSRRLFLCSYAFHSNQCSSLPMRIQCHEHNTVLVLGPHNSNTLCKKQESRTLAIRLPSYCCPFAAGFSGGGVGLGNTESSDLQQQSHSATPASPPRRFQEA